MKVQILNCRLWTFVIQIIIIFLSQKSIRLLIVHLQL